MRAKYYLGWLNQKGLGLHQDYKKAVDYYKSVGSYRSAKSNLAYLEYQGKGIKQDKDNAKKILKEIIKPSFRKTDSIALGYLGDICLAEGNKNDEICCDKKETTNEVLCGQEYGKKLLKEAFNKWNYSAAYSLYKFDKSNTKFLKIASDKGISEAQWEYFLYWEKQEKYQSAFKLLQKLEPNGNKAVFLKLGWFYFNCHNTKNCSKPDYDKAFDYYLRSVHTRKKDPDLELPSSKEDIQTLALKLIDQYFKQSPKHKDNPSDSIVETIRKLAEEDSAENVKYQYALGVLYEK